MDGGLRFRVLGRVAAEREGEPVDLGPPRQRELLTFLLLHPRQPVPTDRLVDALWGERPPESARSMVHLYVSRLRRSLNGADESPLRRTPDGYVLDVTPEQIDAEVFERLLAAQKPDEALRLWRGRAFEGFEDAEFAASAARRLEELRLTAVEEHLDVEIEAGRQSHAIPDLQRLVREHPYRERLHALLMLALYRARRQAEALDAYAVARRSLVEELGLDPSAELQDLQRRILTQDPVLRSTRARGAPETQLRRRAVSRSAAVAAVVIGGLAAAAAIAAMRANDSPALLLDPNSIGRIDPKTNRIVESVEVGTKPQAVAIGHGSIWVADAGDQTVERIDRVRLQRGRTFPTGGTPTAIAVDPDGVWVRNNPEDTLVEIDPRFATVSEPVAVPDGLDAAFWGGGTPGISAGGGRVWTASPPSAVVAIDARSHRRTFRKEILDGATGALAFGDGTVWIAGNRAVTELDPAREPGSAVMVPDQAPTAIAMAASSVWVAYANRVTVIGAVEHDRLATLELSSRVGSLAATDDAVWAALPSEGAVVRIDAHERRQAARIEIGASPTAIATRGDDVWVAAQ